VVGFLKDIYLVPKYLILNLIVMVQMEMMMMMKRIFQRLNVYLFCLMIIGKNLGKNKFWIKFKYGT
jgi:hypothetical protein